MAAPSSLSSLSTLRLKSSLHLSPKPSRKRFMISSRTITIRAAISKRPFNTPITHSLPLIGPWKDRQDYFYNQGRDEFFRSRIQNYNSTVFRTNMPPGPFISFKPNVVVLLDGKSFPVLFDVNKVEKKDLFTSTYMPSINLTGGYRTLSFLDPSEPNHAKLKKLMFYLLSYLQNIDRPLHCPL